MSIKGIISRFWLSIAAVAAIACALVSCDRRPLEVYYLDKARVVLLVDWESEYKSRPMGMTVAIYNEEGKLYQRFSRNEIDSVQLSLPVGHYTAVVFNGAPDEFSSFSFVDMDRLDLFRIEAASNTSRNTTRLWDEGTRYNWEPDEKIGRGIVSFDVTQEMLDRQLQFIDYHDRDQAYTHMSRYAFTAVVQPLLTMIHINVHVNGIEYMYNLEASLSGMADGCSMLTRWRNTTTCNVFYDSSKWGYEFDNPGSSNGWVRINIPLWGEPHGKERQEDRVPADNVLRMNFTLRDRDHTADYYEFEVGDLIYYKEPQQDPNRLTPPDVLRHLYLTINREIPLLPPVDPEEPTGAGFNAHVDPWDYGGEWDLGTF